MDLELNLPPGKGNVLKWNLILDKSLKKEMKLCAGSKKEKRLSTSRTTTSINLNLDIKKLKTLSALIWKPLKCLKRVLLDISLNSCKRLWQELPTLDSILLSALTLLLKLASNHPSLMCYNINTLKPLFMSLSRSNTLLFVKSEKLNLSKFPLSLLNMLCKKKKKTLKLLLRKNSISKSSQFMFTQPTKTYLRLSMPILVETTPWEESTLMSAITLELELMCTEKDMLVMLLNKT